MDKDQSNKNLQKASFKNEDLAFANFSGSDLRGADFSGADLTGANFTQARTGIAIINIVLIFLAAVVISLLSGYFAMLVGRTIQTMLRSTDANVRNAGIIALIINILFILYGWWKGGSKAIWHLIVPATILAVLVGIVAYVSGAGTGKGMLYLVLSFFWIVIMFIIGTIARAAAGTLSNILFVIVALSGGMFGKSVGGGIAAVIMAISCAMISKKALGGAKGFDFLRRIASSITKRLGTSFRDTKLTNASFSQSRLRNADFSNADISSVNWDGAKKMNCIDREGKFTSK